MGDSDSGKKKRTKDTKKKKKKSKTDVDEALEDSDDGDDEGREVDYMSDESSDSEEELEKEHDIKGVDQDEGISKKMDRDEKRKAMVANILDPNASGESAAKKSRLEQ